MNFEEIINADTLFKSREDELKKLELQNSDIQKRIKELKGKLSNPVNIYDKELTIKKLDKKPVFNVLFNNGNYNLDEFICILRNAKDTIYKRCIENDTWARHELKKYTLVLHIESFAVKNKYENYLEPYVKYLKAMKVNRVNITDTDNGYIVKFGKVISQIYVESSTQYWSSPKCGMGDDDMEGYDYNVVLNIVI